MLKKYIASYTNGRQECWDLIIYAKNWKEANREAVRYGRENREILYSVRLFKQEKGTGAWLHPASQILFNHLIFELWKKPHLLL